MLSAFLLAMGMLCIYGKINNSAYNHWGASFDHRGASFDHRGASFDRRGASLNHRDAKCSSIHL